MPNVARRLTVRLRQATRLFRPSSLLTLVGVGLGFLTIAIAAWSVENADWIAPEPSLITTLALSLAAAFLLAVVPIRGIFVALALAALGVVVTGWQSTGLFPPTAGASSFDRWLQTMSESSPSEGTIYFAMFLVFAIWVIGCLTTWFILRRRNAWPGVITGTALLLGNLGNVPHEDYYFFPLFFFSAVMLLAVVNLARQGRTLLHWRDRPVRRGMVSFGIAVVSITTAAVGIAYFIPEPPISDIGLRLDTSSLGGKSVEELSFNIFADVRSKWTTLRSRAEETIFFKDPLESGGKVHFLISAEKSDYWRTRRYDVYQPFGWSSTVESGETLRSLQPIDYELEIPRSRTLTYSVENRLKTDVVLSAGEVSTAEVPLRVQVFSTDGQTAESGIVNGEVRDLAALVSAQIIGPYQRYRVTTEINTATPEELKLAGARYPDWVTERYLQLPANFPRRIRDTAATVTQDARTPYDKAMAIKAWLRQFHYDQTAEAPPANTDGVSYFLFGSERGVCTNFASAMAVMLRASGVPTRVATGYFRGERDESNGLWVIRGRNFHAWVEVYFPTYGWIEFEATPAGPGGGTGAETIDESGFNFSFTQPEELPFWMTEEAIGPSGPGDALGQPAIPVRRLPWLWIWLISLATLAVIAVFVTREFLDRWVRKLQHTGSITEAYQRMRLLADKGMTPPLDHETPNEFGRRLTNYLPAHEIPINLLTDAYTTVKYSPRRELEERDRVRTQKAWVGLVPALVKHVMRLRRWTLVRLFWKP